MYGFEKRQSEPVWMLVELMTNRGLSGRSWSVSSPKTCLRYAPATRSAIVPGSRMPRMTAPRSIVFDASLRTGWTNCSSKLVARPSASNTRLCQFIPRVPAVIEPPETLETRSSFGR